MTISDLLRNVPGKISFSGITDLERFEERFFEIQGTFGDILGMNTGFAEFVPNRIPPDLQEEVLPWLWLIYPELEKEILSIAGDKLRDLASGIK